MLKQMQAIFSICENNFIDWHFSFKKNIRVSFSLMRKSVGTNPWYTTSAFQRKMLLSLQFEKGYKRTRVATHKIYSPHYSSCDTNHLFTH